MCADRRLKRLPAAAPFDALHVPMLTIAAHDPESPEAAVLIDALSRTLARLTGDPGTSSFDPADVRGPRAEFAVARDASGAAVGCGAIRPLDTEATRGEEAGPVAELKRMYARPGTSGVGRAVLAHLEARALALGYRQLWLSTRRVNSQAVGFYEHHGYRPVAPFGKYVGRRESVCLGKVLAASS